MIANGYTVIQFIMLYTYINYRINYNLLSLIIEHITYSHAVNRHICGLNKKKLHLKTNMRVECCMFVAYIVTQKLLNRFCETLESSLEISGKFREYNLNYI